MWKPYKLKAANRFFRLAEVLFILGLSMLLYLVVREKSLTETESKTAGWIATYLFCASLIFNVCVFYKTNPIPRKVKPQKSIEKMKAKTPRKVRPKNKKEKELDDILKTPGKKASKSKNPSRQQSFNKLLSSKRPSSGKNV
jgi:hypothetical protein